MKIIRKVLQKDLELFSFLIIRIILLIKYVLQPSHDD